MNDYKEFKKDIKKLKKLRKFIDKWFGPRCDTFMSTCECCKKWRLYDILTNNPFDKND